MPATDDYLRSPKSMHRVFCGSAILLFAVTLWMMWADYNDEWRPIQRKAFALQSQRDKDREAKIKSDPSFQKNVADLKGQLEEASKALAEHDSDRKESEVKAKKAKEAADTHLRSLKIRRAERDVARADYNLAVRDDLPTASELLKKIHRERGRSSEERGGICPSVVRIRTGEGRIGQGDRST